MSGLLDSGAAGPAAPQASRFSRHGVRLAQALGVPEEERLAQRARVWTRHGNRVGSLARKVAAELELSPTAQRLVAIAGKYHDIGKLLDPRLTELCHKPRPLTAREIREVSLHSYYGAVYIRTRAEALGLSADEVPVVAMMVGGHHWRYRDFERSRRKLLTQPEFSVEEHREYATLPEYAYLGARILKVVDAYLTMCEVRDYQRTAKTWRAVFRELLVCRGRELDPDVVEALLTVLLPGRRRSVRSVRSRAATSRRS